MKQFGIVAKFYILLAVIALPMFGYYVWNVFGTTIITTDLTSTKQNIPLSSGTLGDDLDAHWTFDGKYMIDNVADSSGNGNNGFLLGQTATSSVIGIIGQALNFDGGDDAVNTTYGPTFGTSDDFSISLWFRSTNLTGDDEDFLASLASISRIILEIDGNGSTCTLNDLHAAVRDEGSATDILCVGWGVDEEWHNFTITYDVDGKLKGYIDGVEGDSVDVTSTGIKDLSDGPFHIGNTSLFNEAFFGHIDDVRIYTRALSPEDVRRLYNLGATTKQNVSLSSGRSGDGLVGHWTFDGPDMFDNVADATGKGGDGIIIGQTSTSSVIGVIGQALDFDGVDDEVHVTNTSFSNLTTITISAWIYPRGQAPGSVFERIVHKRNSNDGLPSFIFNSDLRNLRVEAGFDIASGIWTAGATDIIKLNKWSHVVTTYNIDANNDPKVYLNSFEIGVSEANEPQGEPFTDDNELWIGSRNDGLRNFDGYIDDVRVYNRILSKEEVTELFNMGR